ncbi:hypothetical protein SNE40_023225 [Patella caerulea]|uniref:Uncharacterized protein n=1 Tax=Patella caerulea TaxID=87958 RepID=A0AAN8G2H2_PATCE
MSGEVPKLKLHLYNFEDGQYEESKYVLTSPRSLEACARLDVKPVDLLYKPLSEYQEELLPQDIPLRTIFNIYDEQEQARQTKLQLCRKERSRIIEDERENRREGRSLSLERPSSARPSRRQKCIKITRSYSDDDLSQEKLQRKRTAWATSLGHKRFTHNELEERARELHEESQRLRKILLARKEDKTDLQSRSRRTKSFNSSPKSRSSSVSNLSRTSYNDKIPSRSHSVSRLASSTNSDITIPPRDQRIIEIMKAKREEEIALNKLRRKAVLVWDKDRKLENEARNEAENRRRKLLTDESKIDERRRRKNQLMRRGMEEEDQLLQAEKLKQKNLKWKSAFLNQLHSKEQKLADKRMRDQLKKRAQKKTVELHHLNDMAYVNSVDRQQKNTLAKTQARRENLLHHNNKNHLMNNRNERRLHQSKKNIIDKSLVDELDKSRLLSDLRHSRAKSNYSQMLDSQYRSMRLIHQAREKRQEKARQSMSKMEEELESWRKQVVKDRHKNDNYAENVVHKLNEMKALQAHNKRLAKEIEQKQKLKRIEAIEEAWRYDTQKEMAEKERKVEMLQQDKDYAAEQMRATAKASQNLRDSIRKKYGTDTFDKKVLQAEIHANLGKRTHNKATKNRSSVEIL